MKKLFYLLIMVLLWGVAQSAYSEAMSEQQQQELIESYLYLIGEGPMPEFMEGQPPVRCGTELAFNIKHNRDNFTGKYAAIAETLGARPSLPYSYANPGGYCRIHYATLGSDAVMNPTTDLNSDGIPDYVNKIADIADSVWELEVNQMGYKAPPSDGVNGGDSLKDIYIKGLSSMLYGQTDYESQVSALSYTSFITIDNDYDFWPYNLSSDMNRRLDAARVTIAHEFFHTIHYGLDATEYETHSGYDYVPWWEMTATWMEEMAYDNVNDYYYYLPYYYKAPWYGLQYAVYPGGTVHQYGCVVWPLYLSERFDPSIIRAVWEKCAEQFGSQFLQALDIVLRDSTDGEYDLQRAFNEFEVWNLFTGTKASRAPAGYGFSEGTEYPVPSDSAYLNFAEYEGYRLLWPWPDTTNDGDSIILGDGTPLTLYKSNLPQSAGAHILNLQNLSLLSDSIFVFKTVGGAGMKWGVTLVAYPPNTSQDAIILGSQWDTDPIAPGPTLTFNFDPSLYRNVIAVITPTDTVITKAMTGYSYSPIFTNSALDTVSSGVKFSSPYPNPIEVKTDDDFITFKAKISTSSAAGVSSTLKVTIFSVSGDKVNVISSGSSLLFNDDEIAIGWKLDNESGKKVAPGVYLAYCELISNDGSIGGDDKFKIAVIR